MATASVTGQDSTGGPIGRAPAAASPIDELNRAAEKLTPDDRLRLVIRLWSSLPPEHRAALRTLQVEDRFTPAGAKELYAPVSPYTPAGSRLWHALFDRDETSQLYSAPRRFDLATIFVVTAAYSLLFGAMTALDFGPVAKIVIGALITLVGVAQAAFLKAYNPRGVSVVAGVIALTTLLGITWLAFSREIYETFFVFAFIYGILGGAIGGYLAGVLVGGVFLVADLLRGKLEDRSQVDLEKSAESDED
jgi:hypothetical protein